MEVIFNKLDHLSHTALFVYGLMLFSGYFIGKLAALVKLPEITGFIIAGLIMGTVGVVPDHMGPGMETLTLVALGLIALTIGGEFSLAKLKRMGKEVVIITFIQLFLTFLAVFVTLLVLKLDLPYALMAGAIASATAPAATVAIVQSLKAHGKFVDYLYGIVALDDAGCVILFGIVFAIASVIAGGGSAEAAAGSPGIAADAVYSTTVAGSAEESDLSVNHSALSESVTVVESAVLPAVVHEVEASSASHQPHIENSNGEKGHGGAGSKILHSFIEVFGSILAGAISGVLIHFLNYRKTNKNEILIVTVGILFLTTILIELLNLSPLLTNMFAGAVLINMSSKNHRIFKSLEPLTPVVYALFFIIAGTHLNIKSFANPQVLIIGIGYILARAGGKYLGVYTGCALCKVEKPVKNFLGLCMLPQAGVAIGLVLVVKGAAFGGHAVNGMTQSAVLENVIMLSVFVNELVGPPLSKLAIIKGNRME